MAKAPKRQLYASRSGLRSEDMKLRPHPGREFLPNIGEPVKETQDGGFEGTPGVQVAGLRAVETSRHLGLVEETAGWAGLSTLVCARTGRWQQGRA